MPDEILNNPIEYVKVKENGEYREGLYPIGLQSGYVYKAEDYTPVNLDDFDTLTEFFALVDTLDGRVQTLETWRDNIGTYFANQGSRVYLREALEEGEPGYTELYGRTLLGTHLNVSAKYITINGIRLYLSDEPPVAAFTTTTQGYYYNDNFYSEDTYATTSIITPTKNTALYVDVPTTAYYYWNGSQYVNYVAAEQDIPVGSIGIGW